MKSKKPLNLKSWLVGRIRRISLHWPERNEALKAARVERGLYQCAMCKQLFPSNKVHVDHIIPVVKVADGFTNWDDYINGLFVTRDKLQVLCESDHKLKTEIEDLTRKKIRELKRNAK